MHLKTLSLKGFKSFPDRTRLDFGPGVSVVVGPNGSGKSNITDAVLWAMGEQSPLAVRGQSMQDVIFGGGRGVQARSSAEVEIVLDNSDGTVALPLSEISIVRRLHRSGEGEYRLNGARCRLVDVIEVLSDTGLGKETHSVISQGRVESIVSSKPRDRRLLIEEAAGLGKHRKRRRRAQLKLERTQDNLDRALDVEREARSRLRPLKRQAEAAELHVRLERQMLEARFTLARETLRVRRLELVEAQARAQTARAARTEIESGLQEVVERRALAERALGERSERHDELSRRALHAGAAAERLQLRHEQAAATAAAVAERMLGSQREIELLTEASVGSQEAGLDPDGEHRIEALEQQLAELEREREQQLERELAELEREREQVAAEVEELDVALGDTREAHEQADGDAEQARDALREAERTLDAARRDAARVGSELAAVNQFLRHHSAPLAAAARTVDDHHAAASDVVATSAAPRALSEALRVAPGYELALAAALGARLDAVLVPDLARAAALLDRSGPDGATALLAGDLSEKQAAAAAGGPSRSDAPPAPGARHLLELVDGPAEVLALAARLLCDAWVVERLEELPGDFAGVAVTPHGRVWFAASGEVRQVAEGGSERVLAKRNERERLLVAVEQAAVADQAARNAAERAQDGVQAAERLREEADGALRGAVRDRAHAVERERHVAWLIEQRRAAPEQGPLAVRRAQLEGELAAERRAAERLAREYAERLERLRRLQAQHTADSALAPLAGRLAVALRDTGEAVAARAAELQQELDSYRAAGEEMTSELRACAAREAEIQTRLRAQGEAVTAAEVTAQRLRDHEQEAALELRTVRQQLELPDADRASEAPEADGVNAVAEVGGASTETDGASTEADGVSAASESESEADGASAMSAQPQYAQPEDADEEHQPLDEEQVQALTARLERLRRRREQLGPVNPLAKEEYAEALAHVEELEARRGDLETALRELRTLIRDTDRQIHDTFSATFDAAARNFEELASDLFPGGGGRLRLVKDALVPRPVLGGEQLAGEDASQADAGQGGDASAESGGEQGDGEPSEHADPAEEVLGVEIEITPAGKSAKRLSLLSGGEKSMTALAFLFAVFLARPCPFYILDEVEAALDDLNLERFLSLLRRYAGRAQFIVITHQKRTMEAADWLYGVSMAGNGVSKVLSRRLPAAETAAEAASTGTSVEAASAETSTEAVSAQLPVELQSAEAQAEDAPAELHVSAELPASADPPTMSAVPAPEIPRVRITDPVQAAPETGESATEMAEVA